MTLELTFSLGPAPPPVSMVPIEAGSAGDVGTVIYAFVGSFVMNAAGLVNLRIQLRRLGSPPSAMPMTVGLPPGASPLPNQPTKVVVMTIGATSYTDAEGVVHLPGTWANYTQVGTEFPVGGLYNVELQYENPAINPTTELTSEPLLLQVMPTF